MNKFTPSAAFLALPADEQAAFLAKLEAGNAKDLAGLRVATEAEHVADVAATACRFDEATTYPDAATAAREAGIAWADREAEALEGAPAGVWLSSAVDARPLVADLGTHEEADLAEVCNAAAALRWADLVAGAEAEQHFAADAQA